MTLENKINPPLLLGLERGTFQSWVRRSNHWAIPTPPQYEGGAFSTKLGAPVGKLRLTADFLAPVGKLRLTADFLAPVGKLRLTADFLAPDGKLRLRADFPAATGPMIFCNITDTEHRKKEQPLATHKHVPKHTQSAASTSTK